MIQKIISGELRMNSVVEKTDMFSGMPHTNISNGSETPQNIHVNPSALPVKGSIVRKSLTDEKVGRKAAQQIQKEQERKLRRADRHEQQVLRIYGGFQLPRPFTPDRKLMNTARLEEAEVMRKEVEAQRNPEKKSRQPVQECQQKSEFALNPRQLIEAESRKTLIDVALKRKDQNAIMSISLEDMNARHDCLEQFLEMLEGKSRHPSKDSHLMSERISVKSEKKKRMAIWKQFLNSTYVIIFSGISLWKRFTQPLT